MSMRLTHVQQDNNTGELTDPVGYTTVFDGQAFFWAPGEKRAFASDADGVGHAANAADGAAAGAVIEDNASSGKKNPDYASRA